MKKFEKDTTERQRTVRFFIQGSPEMLALMTNQEALDKCVHTICGMILRGSTNVERKNVTQVEDELGQKLCSWILFVVLDEYGNPDQSFECHSPIC